MCKTLAHKTSEACVSLTDWTHTSTPEIRLLLDLTLITRLAEVSAPTDDLLFDSGRDVLQARALSAVRVNGNVCAHRITSGFQIFSLSPPLLTLTTFSTR